MTAAKKKTARKTLRKPVAKFPLYKDRLFDMPSWMIQGLCAEGSYPDLWFPETAGRMNYETRQAIEICTQCPVKELCLAYAMKHGEHGVWGGTTEQQRAEMSGRKRARRVYS